MPGFLLPGGYGFFAAVPASIGRPSSASFSLRGEYVPWGSCIAFRAISCVLWERVWSWAGELEGSLVSRSVMGLR